MDLNPSVDSSKDTLPNPDPDVLFEAATVARQSGQLDRAAYYCELVLQLDPHHRAAH
jgi:hypothetical protein